MSRPAPREGRILAVDDDEPNLRLLRRLLEREGYGDVRTTSDPAAALPLFHDFHPDLVVLDLRMPGLDGFAVMDRLRSVIPADDYLPVLVLTGDDQPEVRQRALASGATDFLTKPFDPAEALLRIGNLLHTRALHQALRAQNRGLEEMVLGRTLELQDALRRAEAASLAKSLFLAKVSHELRTPLSPIRGAVELLRELDLPAPAPSLLEMAANNTDRLVALVDDILLLQGIEQGEVTVRRAPVDLRALAGELVAEMQGRVPEGVRLDAELPGAAALLDTDAVRLRDVLRRLLENALRFTPTGTVTVRLLADPATARPLFLEVADTGVGIPLERRAAVFEPFEQADNSTTRAYDGAGLGLAISRLVCGLLGYRLSARSEPGRGSTFRVEL